MNHERPRAPRPSARPASALPGRTDSVLSWPHPLKVWSLQETRGGSPGCRPMTIASLSIIAPTLCLLTITSLAGSASAECAWVLWMSDPLVNKGHWEHAGDAINIGPPSPEIFNTRPECEQEALDRNKTVAVGARILNRLPPKFVCVPDTVDPLGPKAK